MTVTFLVSMVVLLLPLIQEGLLSVTSGKDVHEVLVNRLVKFAKENL